MNLIEKFIIFFGSFIFKWYKFKNFELVIYSNDDNVFFYCYYIVIVEGSGIEKVVIVVDLYYDWFFDWWRGVEGYVNV